MNFSTLALAGALCASTANGFSPMASVSTPSSSTSLMGYLDNLSSDLYGPNADPIPEEEAREANVMNKEDVVNAGVGNWDDYVEFDEFDGGDGQMGVAGDGNKGLDKFDMSQMAKSKTMSAKNAWGTSTGYADTLIEKGMDTSRAQQLENWHNQQEVLAKRKQQRFMTDDFDNESTTSDENWRQLATFGVERNQEFDMDETFGAVQAEVQNLEGTIELLGQMNAGFATHEMTLKNPYMGFADFRAAFSGDTPAGFTVTPTEGSLKQKEATLFTVKFNAQQPGAVEGYLVIETEDFKKTWKVVGRTG